MINKRGLLAQALQAGLDGNGLHRWAIHAAIMGAPALISRFVGVSYVTVMTAAIVPALFYLLVAVHDDLCSEQRPLLGIREDET